MAKEITVQGINVKYKRIEQEDYISLTDIACMRNPKEPKDVVKSWMRNRSTLEYLALWENFYNPNFKGDEIDPLLFLTGRNDFTIEADLLNVALFGKTAVQWRKENPSLKGNIRDYATIEQLLVIANMESLNAYLIEQNIPQEERLKQLNNMARSQLRVLQESSSWLLEEGKDK